MSTNERPDLGRVTDWCRKRVCSWRKARKLAVRLARQGKPVAWIAAAMRVDRQWVHKWLTRFHEGGKTWTALDDRSCRPRRVHRKRDQFVDEILKAKNGHPWLGAHKLKLVHGIELSHESIHRVLREHGLVKLAKKTWRTYRRFQRPVPNYLWQLDITQIASKDNGWVFVATLIDDHSRFILASKTFAKELNTGDVVALVRTAVKQWGKPRQILTDRGSQFHVTSDDPSLFTLALHESGIQHIKARPHHPRTCGKIERWHRSFKEWLDHHPQPSGREQASSLLARWVEHYNVERPHLALGNRVPVEVFAQGVFMNEAVYRVVNEVA